MDGCIGMGIDDLIGEGEWNGAEPRVSANKLGGKTCMVTHITTPVPGKQQDGTVDSQELTHPIFLLSDTLVHRR